MKQVIEKLAENKISVQASVMPDGAKSNAGEFKQIPFTVIMDLSLVNPNAVEIPEHVLSAAVGQWLVDWRPEIKNQVKELKTFVERYHALEKIAATVQNYTPQLEREPGEKVTMASAKSHEKQKAEMIINFRNAYKPKAEDFMELALMPVVGKEEWAEFNRRIVELGTQYEKGMKHQRS